MMDDVQPHAADQENSKQSGLQAPRNHFNLQREVAGFRRPLRISGGAQHCRQIPFQLDPQVAVVRSQDDGR